MHAVASGEISFEPTSTTRPPWFRLQNAPICRRGTGAEAPSGCQLGNGVQHVISIVFDNVHFFGDNPNVPSDLEQMPHLLNFLESNGTVLSNVHTPLIAHTADDSLTIY